MASEFKVVIGAELAAGELDAIKNQINGLKPNPIKITLDANSVKTEINAIKQQILSLSKIKINLSGGGSGGRGYGQINQVTAAYREMMSVINQMGSVQSKLQLLDTKKDAVQVKELGNQLEALRTRYYSLQDAYEHAFNPQQINNLLNALDKADNKVSASMAKMADTTFMKQQSDAYKELLNIAKQMNNIELKIGGLKQTGGNTNQILELEAQYKSLQATYQQLQSSMSVPLSHDQMQNILTQIGNTHNQLALLDAKIMDTKAKLASGIQLKVNNGDLDRQFATLDNSFQKLGNSSKSVIGNLDNVKNALSNLKSAIHSGDVDSIIQSYENYKNVLKSVDNQIKTLHKNEQTALNSSKLQSAKTALSSSMDVWLKDNSAAAKMFGAEIDRLKAKLATCDATQLSGIKAEFQEVQRQAKLAGVATQTFGDRLKTQMSKLGTYFSATMLFTQAMRGLRSMYDNVVEVDTAMTGLYRVTNLTSEQYSQLYDKMIGSAKDYGSTLSDVITSTADWVRLGFNADDSVRLSEITAMYQHVTDLDNSTAVSNLVTAYKGFQDQLLELNNGDATAAMEMVADIYDKLGNEFAVSAADVGSGLSKSASTLQMAGNSIQESAAMLTGITEVTQDPEKAGNALKILSLRLRGMKGELEELGEDVDENVTSLSKMQTQVLNLSHGKVNIFNDDGSFKSTYEIMDAIAEIYDELSDPERASLLETIAGKNRANDVASLISNWEQVEKALQVASNAEGTAAAENEKYMNSLQGHLDSLTASWQTLSNTFINSDFLRGLIEGLSSALDVLNSFIDTFGTIPTLATAISGVMSLRGNGLFKVMDGQIKIFGNNINSTIGNVEKITTAINRYNNLSTKSASFQNAYNAALAKSDSSLGKYLSSLNGAKASFGGYIASLASAKVASIALQAATMALNMALTMGIAFAIQAVVTGLNNFIHAAKNASQAADDLALERKQEADAAMDEVASLDSLIQKYKELKSSETQDDTTRASIRDIQNQIVDLVGNEANGIDLVNGKLQEQLGILGDIQRESAEKAVESGTASYHASKNSSDSAVGDDSFLMFDGYAYTGKREKELEKILKDNGYGGNVQSGGFFGNTLFVTDSFDNEMNQLETAGEKLEYLRGMIDVIKNNYSDYSSSDLYTGLVQQAEAYEEYVNKQVGAAQDLLNSVITLRTYDNELKKINVNSADTYEDYRQNLIDLVNNSPELKEAFSAGDLTTTDVESFVNSYMSTLSSFSNYYDEWFSKYQQKSEEVSEFVSQYNEEQQKKVKDSFNDNSITQWFNTLSPDDKELVYEIGLKSDDTTLYTLTRWQSELDAIKQGAELTGDSVSSFQDILNNTDEGNFSDYVDSYSENITKLKEALSKNQAGSLEESEKVDLAMTFPELAPYINDTNALNGAIEDLINTSNSSMNTMLDEMIENLAEKSPEAAAALMGIKNALNDLSQINGFNFDIDAEIERFNNLYDAMKESVSGTGLSTNAIKTIDDMFSGLEGYDPSVLFERTEHGIHMNTTALRALQSQYENTKKLDIQNELQDLKQKYNDTKVELEGLTEGTDEYNQTMAKLNGIKDQINDVQTLAAQYEGLTSAYNKWIMAQSAGEEGDMYDNITGSLKDIKQLYDDGLVGTNAFRSAVQMMTNEDLSTASIDKLIATYQAGYPAMQRYFTEGQEGCVRFLEDIQKIDSNWASMNENGDWKINFGVGNDEEIAKAVSEMTGLQLSTEEVQILMRKLSDYGFDVNLDSAYTSVEDLKSRIEETESKLKELGQEPVDINVNVEGADAEAELEKAKTKIEEIKNSDASIEVKTAQLDDAYAKIDVLVSKINQPTFMSLDATQVDTELQDSLTLLQSYQDAVNNLNSLQIKGADTTEIESAKTKVDELASKIEALPEETKTKIGLEASDTAEDIKSKIAVDEVKVPVSADVTQAQTDIATIEGEDVVVNVTTSGNEAIDNLKTAIDGITDKNVTITATVTGAESLTNMKTSVDNLTNKTVTATATTIGKDGVDGLKTSIDSLYDRTVTSTAKVVGIDLVNALKKAIDALYNKTVQVGANVFGTSAVRSLKSAIDSLYNRTVTTTNVTRRVSEAQGTAHASGTAFAKGDWGTKESGVALGGEVGQELVSE